MATGSPQTLPNGTAKLGPLAGLMLRVLQIVESLPHTGRKGTVHSQVHGALLAVGITAGELIIGPQPPATGNTVRGHNGPLAGQFGSVIREELIDCTGALVNRM